MHLGKRKKQRDKAFGKDRIKRPGKKTERLLEKATSIPVANIYQKQSELEVILKTALPLLAEDEKEELQFAIHSYLEIYQDIGGVYVLSLEDLKKRYNLFKIYQFEKEFLVSPLLTDSFGDDIDPIRDDFEKLLDYFLDKKTINPDLIGFSCNKDGIAPLIARWQAVLKSTDSFYSKIEQGALENSDLELNKKILMAIKTEGDMPCYDDFVSIAFENSPDSHRFLADLEDLISPDNSFEKTVEAIESLALIYAIPTGDFIDCLEDLSTTIYKDNMSEGLRVGLFYKYRELQPEIKKQQNIINKFLQIAQKRDAKATRLLKRLQD